MRITSERLGFYKHPKLATARELLEKRPDESTESLAYLDEAIAQEDDFMLIEGKQRPASDRCLAH